MPAASSGGSSERCAPKGRTKLVIPVIVYGTVISVMLYAAMSTIYDPAWKASAALFVSVGAFLFCASDVDSGME